MLLYSFSIAGYEWILGLGIMFGLSFVMNYLTYNDMGTFVAFLTIFNAFMVLCGLLPSWTLIISLIISVVMIFIQIKAWDSNIRPIKGTT